MSKLLRRGFVAGATAGALAVLIGGVGLFLATGQPGTPADTAASGADGSKVPPAEPPSLQAAMQRGQELKILAGRLHKQSQALDHLAVRLLLDEVTLPAAVEQARPILQRRPGCMTVLQTYYPQLTDRQRVACFLIERAKRLYEHDPSLWYTAARRLEQAFERLE